MVEWILAVAVHRTGFACEAPWLSCEESAERVQRFRRGFLGKEVTAVDALTLYVRCPISPDFQDRGSLMRFSGVPPERQHRAGDLAAGLTVRGVEFAIDRGARPIIFAGGVDGCGVTEAAEVFGHRIVVEAIRIARPVAGHMP